MKPLTRLKERYERAAALDLEIKQLEKMPPNPREVTCCMGNNNTPVLSDELLREVIRVGTRHVLDYKKDEFNSIVGTEQEDLETPVAAA